MKDGITGEKWPGNLASDSDCHINHRVRLHAANLLYFPSEERHAVDFSPEKSDGFGRDRTRDLGSGQHANH
jgi:hypothetical protein